MSGSSNLSGDESILFTDNMSFDGTERGGKMTTDGQLFIGHTASTRANNGGHVVLGSITSPGGTITVGFSDPNITLDVAGGSMAVDSFALQGGISPVVPDGAGLVTFQGTTVAAFGTPVGTFGSAANTMQLRVQFASAIAATDATQVGLSSFENSQFAVDANGFVTLVGGAGLPAVQTLTGDDGTAVGPNASGNIDLDGIVVANAANAKPLFFDNEAVNVLRAELQVSTERTGAPANSNDAGISSFDDTSFAVDANGYVTLSTTGVGKTITGDSGGALSPVANNWNILGRSGSKTSGSGATLTVNSPPFSDQAIGATVTLNSGSFATAAITLTTPATAGLADGDLVQFVATNGALVVQMNTGQVGHLGSASTSSGGTFTGSATGDSLTLRWQASSSDWWATSSIGVWILA